MLKLIPIPAFADNYLWLSHVGKVALSVAPGGAVPVMRVPQSEKLRLESILVTHHHADHTNSLDAKRNAGGAAMYDPAKEKFPALSNACMEAM